MSWHHRSRGTTWRSTWRRLRRVVLDRDDWRCTACGRPGGLEVHHLRPLEEGGDDDMANLATRCRDCHLRAHGKRPVLVDKDWERLVAAVAKEYTS